MTDPTRRDHPRRYASEGDGPASRAVRMRGTARLLLFIPMLGLSFLSVLDSRAGQESGPPEPEPEAAARPTSDLPPALPSDAEAVEALLRVAGDGFRVHETDRFNVAYDTPTEVVSALVGRIEATYNAVWRFAKGEGLLPVSAGRRLAVIVYDGFEEYSRFCRRVGLDPASIAGFYDHQTNVAAFNSTESRPELRDLNRQIEDTLQRLSAQSREGGRSDELRRTIHRLNTIRDRVVEHYNRVTVQHEAAHQVLFNLGIHVAGAQTPKWLAEGLACQFEIPQTYTRTGLGKVNHMRLADFRAAFDVPPTLRYAKAEHERVGFDTGRMVRLEELVANPELFHQGGANLSTHYAGSWSLVLYLHRRHRPAFTEYLRVLMRRRPGVALDRNAELRDFQASFGANLEALERDWVRFTLSLAFDRHQGGA